MVTVPHGLWIIRELVQAIGRGSVHVLRLLLHLARTLAPREQLAVDIKLVISEMKECKYLKYYDVKVGPTADSSASPGWLAWRGAWTCGAPGARSSSSWTDPPWSRWSASSTAWSSSGSPRDRGTPRSLAFTLEVQIIQKVLQRFQL